MEINLFEKIGILIVFLDLFWLLVYYYYGTVKVYNLTELKEYKYLGFLWIRRKKGEYYLKIPKAMVEESCTTQYKILVESLFVRRKMHHRLRIYFPNKYDVYMIVEEEITVKNHIATSNQL